MTNEKVLGKLLDATSRIEEKRKPLSEVSLKQSQNDNGTDDLMEIAESRATTFEQCVYETLDRGRKTYPNRDFYIYINHKREQALHKVIRNLYGIRLTCPNPNYEQTVYKFHVKDERLEFIWSVPNRDICKFMYENRTLVSPGDYDVLRTVIDFRDGELYKKALMLDGLL